MILLIVEPLSAGQQVLTDVQKPPFIVIIDGLDERKNEKEQIYILLAIALIILASRI